MELNYIHLRKYGHKKYRACNFFNVNHLSHGVFRYIFDEPGTPSLGLMSKFLDFKSGNDSHNDFIKYRQLKCEFCGAHQFTSGIQNGYMHATTTKSLLY